MARTHKAILTNLKRIVQLKRVEIPRLEKEVYLRGDRLGTGTYRAREIPGLKVVIAEPQTTGTSTSWKDVAWELAGRYGVPDSEVLALARNHTSFTTAKPGGHLRVGVHKERAKDINNVKGIVI